MDIKSKVPRPARPIGKNPMKEVAQNLNRPQPLPVRPMRRSQSCLSLRSQSSVVKPMTGSKTQDSARVGAKRMAPKIDSGVKPKVIKQSKIPDWDYKNRFLNLSDKYAKLQEVHRILKDQVAGAEIWEEKYKTSATKCEELETINRKLERDVKEKNKELGRLKNVDSDLKELKCKYEEIYTKSMDMTSKIRDLTHENSVAKSSLEKLDSHNKELQQRVSDLSNDVISSENLRRKLHNNIQDLKGNIRVFCRVRPPINDSEKERLQCLISYPDESSLEIRKSKESINSASGKPNDCKLEFTFDYVFTEESTQAEFFEELSQLVQSAIDGYHVCVFAYGQTGSGKTYTMQGEDSPEHLGMIPRTVNLIFDMIENLSRSNWFYDVKVSFLEIYNESVRDLLDPNANHSLDICFNEGKGTTVTNLKIKKITSYEEFNHYLQIAQRNRMVAATDFNEHSSRSHAITKIYLSGTNGKSNQVYTGSINLVDLAGSESAKTSHGDRLVETKNINKSLSTLGNVMLALHNKDKHVPYRNSKLTYLLQSCLGGNSKTMMIVNISPFEDNYGESVHSLRFAAKVKEVKTRVKRNKMTAPLCNKLL